MKKLILAVAIALAGCTPASVNAPPTSVSDMVVLEGTRAFVMAEYAYKAAAETGLALTRAGVIHGEAAQRLRTINSAATAALVAGHAARDAAARAAEARTLFDLVARINAEIPR
jgi:NAD(P)H-hydrate repair Nnr-like enzyme with NAD(P)H-hydrate dehydratase domain